MKNSKKTYMIPMVEIMSARVEKGFAGSGETPDHTTGTGGLNPITPSQGTGTGGNNTTEFVD